MSMREYGVVEAQNLAMGQAGSIFVTAQPQSLVVRVLMYLSQFNL